MRMNVSMIRNGYIKICLTLINDISKMTIGQAGLR